MRGTESMISALPTAFCGDGGSTFCGAHIEGFGAAIRLHPQPFSLLAVAQPSFRQPRA